MNATVPATGTRAPERLAFATCPSCRTTHRTMADGTVGNGADWQCARCGQKWSATRLATVAAYATWVSRQTTQPGDRS